MLGFYDSGIGGLTIVEKFGQLRPGLKSLYLADTANCPLGNKTDEEILDITKKGVEFLFQQGCDLVILACNTATSMAIRHLQQDWLPLQTQYSGKNILGVVKPVTEELTSQRHEVEPILVLATKATCRSEFYQQELRTDNFEHYDCLSFADLALSIEMQDAELIQKSLENGFASVDVSKYSSFVLACTHYPLVTEQIKTVIKQTGKIDAFKIINQAELVARKLDNYLTKHPKYLPSQGRLTIYISQGDPVQYAKKVKKLFDSIDFDTVISLSPANNQDPTSPLA